MSPGSKFTDEMIGKLETILAIVNDWLKFAEAKNAVLLGFSGAGFTATITYLSTASSISRSAQIGISITTVFLFICAFICSLSFLPQTNLEVLVWKKYKPGRKRGTPKDEDNLYFFGHLYKYNENELINAINRLYFDRQIQNLDKKEYKDLASQVVINSEIVYLKFKFFTWAVYWMMAALLCMPFSILASLFF